MRRHLLNALLYVPTREITTTPADVGLAYEDLAITTADRERLHGWWVPTPIRPALGHILFFHGNAGNMSRRVPDAQVLAAEGFDVLMFDYRGYGQSTGRATEEGTYRDSRAALTALRARAGVTPERIFYLGESLGAAIALALALEEPPAGLVMRSPFTCILDMARLVYPMIPEILVPDAYPSVRRVASLACPLLVLHGDCDQLIPLKQGQAVFAAAPAPKRMEILSGVGHNDILTKMGPAQTRMIGDWARGIVGDRPR
jgi:pimeloyl-ACP methyl ester carboxylesterase